ncbi:MAG: hypothetical protein RSD46_01230 [Oscillospiraceae bacterium]
MDWKREAVDKLKCYEAKRSSAERAEMEMRRLEGDMASIRSATTDGTPVSGGSSTREDMMINNIAHRDELKRAMQEAKAWVKIVESGLAVLDEEERLLLDRFFIHRAMDYVDRLCGELNLEKSRVYERKDMALRHFTMALYGVTET